MPKRSATARHNGIRQQIPLLPGFVPETLPQCGPLMAGIDEAGRGCLAGPVVAACVILPDNFRLDGLDDSKKLKAEERERLYPVIQEQALFWGIGAASPAVIDRINILQATFTAMAQACSRLGTGSPKQRIPVQHFPGLLLIDGSMTIPEMLLSEALARRLPGVSLPRQKNVIKGDHLIRAISAASILAKVWRDRYMTRAARLYPGYGLEQHKGYGTEVHRKAIAALGPTPLHRLTFAGVREFAGQGSRQA